MRANDRDTSLRKADLEMNQSFLCGLDTEMFRLSLFKNIVKRIIKAEFYVGMRIPISPVTKYRDMYSSRNDQKSILESFSCAFGFRVQPMHCAIHDENRSNRA